MSVPATKNSVLHTMSRGRRRALVLVMQLSMVAYALTFAFSGTDPWWDVVLVLCLELLYMVIFFRFLRPIMSEVIKKDRDLDERELSLRNAAHYRAFQILSSAITTVTAAPATHAVAFHGAVLPIHEPEYLAASVGGRVDRAGSRTGRLLASVAQGGGDRRGRSSMIGAKARGLSQRQRRVLVLAEYAGISCFPVVSSFTESAWWMLLGLLGAIATVLIHHQLLVPFTQKIANKTDADLDERQTAVRDSAHRTAYEILGAVIIVG